jgi:hypothetical protein
MGQLHGNQVERDHYLRNPARVQVPQFYIYTYTVGGKPKLSVTTWNNIKGERKKTLVDSGKLGHSVRKETRMCSNGY